MGIVNGRHIGFEIHRTDKVFYRSMQQGLKNAGLDDMDGIQGWILGYLYGNQHADIYQKNLEAEFSISKSTVTGIVKSLEDAGYITREDVPGDARLKKILLTEKGMQRHLNVIATFDRIEEVLLTNIDPDMLESFLVVLDRIKQNADQMKGDALC